MSIQEARRAAFEKWHKVCLERSPGQEYYDSDWTDTAWQSWNAALDSVVVELSESSEYGDITDYGSIYAEGVRHASEAIEAAGIRVEVKS